MIQVLGTLKGVPSKQARMDLNCLVTRKIEEEGLSGREMKVKWKLR